MFDRTARFIAECEARLAGALIVEVRCTGIPNVDARCIGIGRIKGWRLGGPIIMGRCAIPIIGRWPIICPDAGVEIAKTQETAQLRRIALVEFISLWGSKNSMLLGLESCSAKKERK